MASLIREQEILALLERWKNDIPLAREITGAQLLIDVMLVLFMVYILLKKPSKPSPEKLSAKEIQELIDEWQPEPLPTRNEMMVLDDKVPEITGTTPTHVTINGKQCLNLVRTNFLGMIGNAKVQDNAIKTIRKYGVGTCGPRGFYGTIDVHMDLERRIQKFMDSEDAVLYSFGFVTVSSAIPTFSGRGDLLIVDEGVNYSVQTGVRLSRSDVIWFKHNDMEDLEKKLRQVQEKDKRNKNQLNRRFIVFEGVYYNYGDIAPLPRIKALADQYKYRLVMDDSCGIGAIGKTGRGTCEHFNIPVKSIDILTADLATTVSSVGGFCCGSKSVIYHQRLNSSGYVYSCSLPPLLATSAISAFDLIDEKGPQMLTQLSSNVELLYQGLSKIKGVVLTSKPEAPIIHMRLENPPVARLEEEKVLQDICDEALSKGVFIARAKYVQTMETFLPPPSIRLCVSAVNSKDQLNQAVQAISQAVQAVLAKKGTSNSGDNKPEEKTGVTKRSK